VSVVLPASGWEMMAKVRRGSVVIGRKGRTGVAEGWRGAERRGGDEEVVVARVCVVGWGAGGAMRG
jgi:hypothetical protein